MTSAIDPALIEKSFELAAERCADITPLVYAKLFVQRPDMEPLFFRDKSGSIKGEMLYRVIDAILDFVGPRNYSVSFFQCEVVTHEGYDVPRNMFALFFVALADTLKDLAGPDWTGSMDKSWQVLLADLAVFSAPSQQTVTVS